jgi:hypothetical protein
VLADVFVAWCKTLGAHARPPAQFEQALQKHLPMASVESVYRDLHSPIRPVRFDRLGGASPVEHWLVATNGTCWLLPCPIGTEAFRDVAPIYEGGHVAPRDLRHVEPARVRPDGDGFALVQPGRIA